MLLRTQKSLPNEFRFVDGNEWLFRALEGVLRKYARGKFKPLVRTAQDFHFGAAECADACMPQDGEKSGWGMVVGDVYAY